MKKSLFTLLAIASLLLGNATNADAQNQVIQADNDWIYYQVRKDVIKGDDEYSKGAYTKAKDYYQSALKDNGECGTHKYISDKELQKKIDDCTFATKHNGKTREQYDMENSNASTQNTANALVRRVRAKVVGTVTK